MKYRLGIILICLLLCVTASACVQPVDSTVIIKENYTPELLLSGDVSIKTSVNLKTLAASKVNGYNVYMLTDVLAKAEPTDKITHIMLLSRSSKAIYINIESAESYYFMVNSKGIISVYSLLMLHEKIAKLPVIGMQELVLCADEPTSAGLEVLGAKYNHLGYSSLLINYGLYLQISNAVSDQLYTLTIFNKQTIPATRLLTGHTGARLTLESGEQVVINQQSSYSMHWANGDLYLIEFITPVKKIEYLTT